MPFILKLYTHTLGPQCTNFIQLMIITSTRVLSFSLSFSLCSRFLTRSDQICSPCFFTYDRVIISLRRLSRTVYCTYRSSFDYFSGFLPTFTPFYVLVACLGFFFPKSLSNFPLIKSFPLLLSPVFVGTESSGSSRWHLRLCFWHRNDSKSRIT